MRRSKTLMKLRAGETVRMCAFGHYIPEFVHLAARSGFDCIWLDLEHRLIDEREVQALLTHFHAADIDCMLRPPTLEKTRLYRYLEDGATGLMIPHVSTEAKARMLVDAVKFPPLGDRGLDGVGYDNLFDLPDVAEYTEAANRETFLVVQIETIEAVNNVEAIAATDGVAGLFVGPGDLGLRLSHQSNSMTLESVIARVAKAAKQNGRAWGLPAGCVEDLKRYLEMGAQLLVHGSEYSAMRSMLEEAATHFDDAISGL